MDAIQLAVLMSPRTIAGAVLACLLLAMLVAAMLEGCRPHGTPTVTGGLQQPRLRGPLSPAWLQHP